MESRFTFATIWTQRMTSWHEWIQAAFANCERDRDSLHDYQEHAIEFLKLNPFSALFIDLGLGKTVISLTTVLDLVCALETDCTLVIGPLRVVNETWPTEIGLWRHTSALSMHRIREEPLVEHVRAAGAKARALIKEQGSSSEEVRAFLIRHRTLELRRRAKNLGYSRGDIRKYALARIGEAMLKPVSEQEKKLFVVAARQKAAAEAVREQKRLNPASIYIINREQVEFLVNAWGKDWPYDTVVVDESSSLKDHRTNRWKALRKVRPFIKRMHQLTATPAAESYLHLFGQIGLLDLGERLGRTYTEFTEKYFKHNKYDYSYKLLPGAAEEIARAISDICLTMKAEDYLSLEKPVFEVRRIDLPENAAAIYRSMEQDSIVELEEREITADTAAALSSKLLQIASGVLYETFLLEDADTHDFNKVKRVHQVHDKKVEDLKDLVAELGEESVLVSYHFKASLDRLRKAFPHAVVMDKEGACVKRWNDGKIKMLLVHPQSAGHGLNLQRGGRHIAFFDIPWSLELYLQLIGRLARQGQKYVVYVHHLVAKGTLDEAVMQCLLEKRNGQEELFKMLKALRRRSRIHKKL